jgi:hypothetical protein
VRVFGSSSGGGTLLLPVGTVLVTASLASAFRFVWCKNSSAGRAVAWRVSRGHFRCGSRSIVQTVAEYDYDCNIGGQWGRSRYMSYKNSTSKVTISAFGHASWHIHVTRTGGEDYHSWDTPSRAEEAPLLRCYIGQPG